MQNSCTCKHYPEFRICLIVAPYASIMSQCTILNMSLYSYNDIIIVTKVAILQFLSARFVHPGALLTFYFFKHELEHKNNESY